MSDSNLDFVSERTTTGQVRPRSSPSGFGPKRFGVTPDGNPAVVQQPATKLDLPGTVLDFANLEGIPASALLTARPFREHDARQSAADATGVATHNFGAPATGFYWLVERLAVKGAGFATVYIGQIADYTVKDFTPTASQDIADESSPIYVPPANVLIVQYTNAGAATVCTTTIQIQNVPFA